MDGGGGAGLFVDQKRYLDRNTTISYFKVDQRYTSDLVISDIGVIFAYLWPAIPFAIVPWRWEGCWLKFNVFALASGLSGLPCVSILSLLIVVVFAIGIVSLSHLARIQTLLGDREWIAGQSRKRQAETQSERDARL